MYGNKVCLVTIKLFWFDYQVISYYSLKIKSRVNFSVFTSCHHIKTKHGVSIEVKAGKLDFRKHTDYFKEFTETK